MADIGLRGVLDLSTYTGAVSTYIRGIQNMTSANQRMASSSSETFKTMEKSGKRARDSWSRVGDIVTGLLIIDVFRRITRAVRDAGLQAVQAAADFQRLQIRFEALAARDFARQFGGTVSEALTKVTGKARELLVWVRQIAVTTPFSVQTLSNIVAYGQAFGFTVTQSQRMAIATGNFVAGMGLTNEHLERIIYNFGQMLASGRILGRELRDLANNFVPVNQIIEVMAERAGISFNEMREKMKEGKIAASEFIGVFLELAEADFPGAMERMSRTISGVTQNVQDFIQSVLGLEVLGPVLQNVAERAADALNAAFDPKVLRSFTAIGLALNKGFEIIRVTIQSSLLPAIREFFGALGIGTPTLLGVVRAMLTFAIALREAFKFTSAILRAYAKVITFLRERFGATFDTLASNAFSWGANVIAAFAQGMVSAIKFVLQALASVARAIANLLRAFSPPKLLPDLPKWGRAAVQSWLDGWASADFSVFQKIAGAVTSYLQSLSGSIDEVNMVPLILKLRTAVGELVNEFSKTGAISESALGRLVSSLQGARKEVVEFVNALIHLNTTMQRIEAVEEALDFDFELGVPKDIFGVVVDSIDDLFKLADKLSGKLGATLRDYANALSVVEQANNRLKDAQDALNATTEHYDDLLRELNNQLEQATDFYDEEARLAAINQAISSGLLTSAEKERLEQEKKQIGIRREIRNVEDLRDAAIDAGEDRVKAEEEALDAADLAFRRQKELIDQIIQAEKSAAEERFAIAEATLEILTETNELISQQIELLKRLAEQGGGGAGEIEEPELDLDLGGFDAEAEIEDATAELERAIHELTLEISAAFNNAKASIRESLLAIWEDIKPDWEGLWQNFTDIPVAFAGIAESDAFKNLSKEFAKLKSIFSAAGGAVKRVLEKPLEELREAFSDLWEEIQKASPIFEPMVKILQQAGRIILQVFGAGLLGAILLIIGIFTGMVRGFTLGLTKMIEFARRAWQGIVVAFDGIRKIIDGVKQVIENVFGGGTWEGIREGLSKILEGLLQVIAGTLYAIASTIAGIFVGILANIWGFVVGIWEFFKELGIGLLAQVGVTWGEVVIAFRGKMDEILRNVGEWIVNVIGKITEKVEEFKQAGKDVIENMKEGMRNIFEGAAGVYAKMTEWIQATVQKVLDKLDAAKDSGIEFVESIMAGMLEKFEGALGLWEQFKTWVSDSIDKVLETVQEWVELGWALIEGLIRGLQEKAGNLWEAVKKIIRDALRGGEDEAGATSPAKEWAVLGSNLLAGVESGLWRQFPSLQRSVSTIMGSLMDTANSYGFGLTGGTFRMMTDPRVNRNPYAFVPTASSIDRSTTLNMNATYPTFQSEQGVANDLMAILSMAKR